MKFKTLTALSAVTSLLATTALADNYLYTVVDGQVVVQDVVKTGKSLDRWIRVAGNDKKNSDDDECSSTKKGNNGHGNDADGNDNSNPGKSNSPDDDTDDDGLPGNQTYTSGEGECDVPDSDVDEGEDKSGTNHDEQNNTKTCSAIRTEIEERGLDAVLADYHSDENDRADDDDDEGDDDDDGKKKKKKKKNKKNGHGNGNAYGHYKDNDGDDDDDGLLPGVDIDIPGFDAGYTEDALEAFMEEYNLCLSSASESLPGEGSDAVSGSADQRIDVIVARRGTPDANSTSKNIVMEIEPSSTNIISLDSDFNGFIDNEAEISGKLRQKEVPASVITKKLVKTVISKDGSELGNGGSKNGEAVEGIIDAIGGIIDKTESEIFWGEMCHYYGLCADD